VKVAPVIDTTHNPSGETCRASCLRENLTSSSYGEGLETDRASPKTPRQSLTRQNRIKELHHGLEIDRTSCTRFLANQLRGLLSAAAYVLYQELRLRAARTAYRSAQVYARCLTINVTQGQRCLT
jgi:Transposase DDE domain group 1